MASHRPGRTSPDQAAGQSRAGLNPGGNAITTGPLPAPIQQILPPLPMSDNLRPSLNPPSHLDPPFTLRSPQLRPHYSDPASYRRSYSQNSPPPGNRPWPIPSGPPLVGVLNASNTSLPPIYPRNTTSHSSLPATTYEPTSPVEAMSHEISGRSSVFDDSTYTLSSAPAAATHAQQSPASSYHSSVTSSSSHMPSSAFASQQPTTGSKARVAEKHDVEDKEMMDRYILQVRQQPLAARACGFGERDRRVLDPPAVVQLSFKDFDPDSSADVAELQYPFHIVHCSLFTVPPDSTEQKPMTDVTSVPDPGKANAMCRRLMGTLVASPFVAVDPEAPSSSNENARLGCFFIFPDLSIRQTGKYRLRFTLMKVPMHNMIEGGQSTVAATVDSDIFEVYVAGHFPGMSASSTLIKELKRQGAAVSLKKGAPSRQKRGGDVSEKSGDEASDAAEAVPGKGRQKKKRG